MANIFNIGTPIKRPREIRSKPRFMDCQRNQRVVRISCFLLAVVFLAQTHSLNKRAIRNRAQPDLSSINVVNEETLHVINSALVIESELTPNSYDPNARIPTQIEEFELIHVPINSDEPGGCIGQAGSGVSEGDSVLAWKIILTGLWNPPEDLPNTWVNAVEIMVCVDTGTLGHVIYESFPESGGN